ncbi:MAG TPA: LysR family transcriptional regulator [Candidatus Limnocylindrales bacterium]|nr:LysR family transcriptional regulator [Candidatus Limnocylindrales bacterium]
MEFRQLELFLAVIECSSVTRAAGKMNLSPGAVSLQLHNLAAELRTDLFVRTGKRLVPTPAALRLAERARVAVAQMRAIEQEFAGDPHKDQLPFRLATGGTALIHQLGRPLRQLRKAYPNVSLDITVAPTEEMVAGLVDRRFDLALISLPFAEEHNLDLIPLFEEELLLIKPSPNPVRGWRVAAIDPVDLEGVSFLLYPKRSNMRGMIDAFLLSQGVTPRVIMEADDTEAIKKLVETGFGYSILPEVALRDSPRFFQIFRFRGTRLARTQALAMVRSDYRRALTDSIARFLHSALAEAKPK